MRISILTLFPEMFRGPLDVSILSRAQKKNLLSVRLINIRDFAAGSYKSVDDHPYGGGVGMIMRVDVLDRALKYVKTHGVEPRDQTRIILLDPQGKPYTQEKARELTRFSHLILVCGHYEGVDERIRTLVDEEISLGDFILTGGEIPALAVIDSVARLTAGVLTKKEATREESFSSGLLEYPQYTRPGNFKGKKVPPILLSGDHGSIAKWRQEQSRLRTEIRRPDLLRGKGVGFRRTGKTSLGKLRSHG